MSVSYHHENDDPIPRKSVSSDHGSTPTHSLEMDDSETLIDSQPFVHSKALATRARHTLGLLLLLCVVFLWTLSNFLGSVCLSNLWPVKAIY